MNKQRENLRAYLEQLTGDEHYGLSNDVSNNLLCSRRTKTNDTAAIDTLRAELVLLGCEVLYPDRGPYPVLTYDDETICEVGFLHAEDCYEIRLFQLWRHT